MSDARKIIHCDCDCFYASIEMRDDPSLAGHPLAVGGQPDRRGVIATCNYEARRYGVRSAMSSAQAVKRCPDLLILPPAMEKYRIASRAILAIYRHYTPLVQPLSLDEAYLDVTGSPHCRGSATLIAQEIRSRIASEVGITASAGVGPNKFIAKIASDWNKPDGQFVVQPHEVDAFVAALPVGKLHGVGRVTAAKLERMGVRTCGDLRRWSQLELQQHFGVFGLRLHALCRGIDARPVEPDQERKSISVETTFDTDLATQQACREALAALLVLLEERVARSGATHLVHKCFVKIKFDDFRQTTAETVHHAVEADIFMRLLKTGWARHGRPVRLLGAGIRLMPEDDALSAQLGLFGEAEAAEDASTHAADDLI